MGCSTTSPWDCVTSITGHAASSVAKDAFRSIADDFGRVAASAIDWLWSQIGSATSVQLGGAGFDLDLGIVAAVAGVVALGLFVLQLITAVLRRDHGGLARAGRGLLVAFLGSTAAIAATNLLLSAVDALSNGVVEAATGGSIEQLGSHLLVASALTTAVDPAGVLLLALVTLVAVVVVWFAMTVRKLLIVVTAVFAPVAFAGSLADVTSSWVRRWVETTVALIVSKLVLVVIFVVGLGILVDGVGQAPASGFGGVAQPLTQAVAGLLVLCLAGFAPWLALRLVHFSGDHFAQLHAHAGAVSSAAGQAVAAPRKLTSQLSGLRSQQGGQGGTQGGSGTATQKPFVNGAQRAKGATGPGSAQPAGASAGGAGSGAAGGPGGGGPGGAGAGAGAGAAAAPAAGVAAALAVRDAGKALATKTAEAATASSPTEPSGPGAPAKAPPGSSRRPASESTKTADVAPRASGAPGCGK